MAYSQSMSPQSVPQHYRDAHSSVTSQPRRHTHASRQRFAADLSQCLYDFVIQLLPTPEEMAVKEDVRKLLERLIRSIEPDSRLLSFGSTANGFSLRNSDMDLCCLIDSEERLSAADLVTMLGDLLERETKFHVKPLPHARIPIIKLSLDPSPGLPLGIACDIGFENRLALENTRLLMCYAMIDPTRVRTMVLFLKVWSKRRKINSPYKGTLSSYGYVLLVIYFLVHIKNPPVLPNLQQVPPLRPITKDETHLNGYNTWFFDDVDLLRQRWRSDNHETVADLLIDFFRYYSKEFPYNTGVASIRAGLLKKEVKGWQNDLSLRYNDARERNRFCIEDPFEVDYNVARCVTKEGLYTIRGEFMRAARILAARPERAIVALAALCEERKEELVSPPSTATSRLLHIPPQTPYGVGSQPMRPKNAPVGDHLSPPTTFTDPGARTTILPEHQSPPEHMAPKRAKWTSPPPPDASPSDHNLYETQFGEGLQMATVSAETHGSEGAYLSSSSNSEVLTDEDRSEAAESDEIHSVQSLAEGSSPMIPTSRRTSWYTHDTVSRLPSNHRGGMDDSLRHATPIGRLRYSRSHDSGGVLHERECNDAFLRPELARRVAANLPRPIKGLPWSPVDSSSASVPPNFLPTSHSRPAVTEPSTVFYQTTITKSPRPVLYPSPGTQSSFLPHYQSHHHPQSIAAVPNDILPPDMPSITSSMTPRGIVGLPDTTDNPSGGPETPTPTSYSHHNHSLSSSTISSTTPPPSAPPLVTSKHTQMRSSTVQTSSPAPSQSSCVISSTGSNLRSRPQSQCSVGRAISPPHGNKAGPGTSNVSHLVALSNSNGNSPAPSSTGYSTTPISRSPSPRSPLPIALADSGNAGLGFLATKFEELAVIAPAGGHNTELADDISIRS